MLTIRSTSFSRKMFGLKSGRRMVTSCSKASSFASNTAAARIAAVVTLRASPQTHPAANHQTQDRRMSAAKNKTKKILRTYKNKSVEHILYAH
jgi:hypothetical protein